MGEDSQDTLAHYLKCDPLWTILISTAGLGVEALDTDPVCRLGLRSPSQSKFTLIGMASRCYLAIRLDNKSLVTQAVNSKDFTDIQEMLFELAGVFLRDLT